MDARWITVDGNEAAARVAYKLNDVIAIYPITPASPMGEFADAWAAAGKKNLFGEVPRVVEMQSEAGAAGAVHGALQAGALTTTFTASQGLLLMIPDMYKIAGELTSAVFHIAARSVATHALSIFGDHSDAMAARQTGWAMLFASSVQEALDFSLIAQAATLRARVPFLHIFDGFRTSHEVSKILDVSDEDIRALVPEELIRRHRQRGLTPERPVIRGTAQNPDVFFQSREAANPYYLATPAIVQQVMDLFAQRTGRRYELFSYVGHPEAERVLVLMGSGCETAEEAVRALVDRGERVGVVKVRLFRPFSLEHFVKALPATVRRIAVLDRTKEPGSAGEPLYQDVVTAVAEAFASGTAPFSEYPLIIGGRYGLSSKEFTPGMVKGIFDHLAQERPKNHFTVGIVDDVTHTSIDWDPDFRTEPTSGVNAIFWGLGSDGTVSANKNTIKIIGETTPYYAQGYFVYDSRKAGTVTVSHVRFGKERIQSAYEVQQADFVGVHQWDFLFRYDVLAKAKEGATVLINCPHPPEEAWDRFPVEVQEQAIAKNLKIYVIDAYRVASDAGVGHRINTVMQTCFLALSGVLPQDEAIEKIKEFVRKSYGKRGEAVVQANFRAIDEALRHLHEVPVPGSVTATVRRKSWELPQEAPEFVRTVTARMLALEGDSLPVSALPADGTFPVGTTKWEKRNIAQEVPVWDPELCIQCGKCVLVCPHAAIRANVYDASYLEGAPEGFKSAPARWKGLQEMRYTLQVAVEDCTGCSLCVEACPVERDGVKPLVMQPQAPLVETERRNWEFFLTLPEVTRNGHYTMDNVKDVQLLPPLFEFSGACAGCGETPYLKLLSQLFGDRALIANATGCSSIYGGNLPTTPWTTNQEGRGPAWSNSLFEDNAEYGLGMRLALDKREERAKRLLEELAGAVGEELAREILEADQREPEAIVRQRERVARLKEALEEIIRRDPDGAEGAKAQALLEVADDLVRRSVWIVGGDGWAYDIGYGGLDHVLASGADVNILVLDTEVYSNTGGQASKATPRGAIAKFAAKGKEKAKKDLAAIAMQYGHVYVATVAMGANDRQTIRAFLEAESYDGPSLIIAYSHCIAHGIEMHMGLEQQRLAVASGHWPLLRYDPRKEQPLQLDSKDPSVPIAEYMAREGRFRALKSAHPEAWEQLLQDAQRDVEQRLAKYKAHLG
ncbi:MAG: pyruvate:ferredoxin (flavodoxin) oxidoreductase [Clostridia bacterium]